MKAVRPPPALVVMGGSAGSLEPMRTVLAGLPGDFPAAICLVVHLSPEARSVLPSLLGRRLPAAFAESGMRLAPGRILVAPPDHHMLIDGDIVRLSRGARENRHRPAIDPLFRTAARAHPGRLASVVFSGVLDDGSAGTKAIRLAGGLTIVQDPSDALFPDMPRAAVATGDVDSVLPADAIAEVVTAFVRSAEAWVPADSGRAGTDGLLDTVDRGLDGPEDLAGTASPFGCPDCGGVLYEREEQLLCRLGHRYSFDSLGSAQEAAIEDALWTALRTLDEEASLAERVLARPAARRDAAMRARFVERRRTARRRAEAIREVLRDAMTTEADASGNGQHAEGSPVSRRD